MASSFKKGSIKSASPRAKPSGMSNFAHVTAPRMQGLKTRTYTKAAARQDPMNYTDFGFGDTGLNSPSLLGMVPRK